MKDTVGVIAFRSQVCHHKTDAAGSQTNCDFLARADRRLLLGASLRLLAAKFSHGRPIFQNEVLRLALLADDGARAQQHDSEVSDRRKQTLPDSLLKRPLCNSWSVRHS